MRFAPPNKLVARPNKVTASHSGAEGEVHDLLRITLARDFHHHIAKTGIPPIARVARMLTIKKHARSPK